MWYLSLVKKLFQFISKKRKIQYIFLFFFSIISSFAETMSIGAVFPLIALISSPETMMDIFLVEYLVKYYDFNYNELIIFIAVSFGVLALLSGLIRIFVNYISLKINYLTCYDLFINIYSNILFQSYEYHVSHNTSEIISIITQKVYAIVTILTNVVNMLIYLITLSFILLILFYIDVKTTVFAMGFFLFFYFFIAIAFKRKVIKNSDILKEDQRLSVKAVQEGLGAIRDVIVDKTHQFYLNIYKISISKVLNATAQSLFIAQAPRFLLESLGLVFLSIIIVFTTNNDEVKFLTLLPILATLAVAAQKILPMINSIYQSHTMNVYNSKMLEEAIIILNLKNDQGKIEYKKKEIVFKKNIEIQNLNFRYKSSQDNQFTSINLKINLGDRIGLMGGSGTGKSTFLDLLMGLLHPTNGEISVDGENIKSNLISWQKNVSHVPQFIYLSDNTLAENIAFGVEKNQIDMKKVKLAAYQAQISEFIESKPEKYHAFVGERGIRLSGGQRQRIGIARALYKNTKLIIFDEATSALDLNNESKIMDTIYNLDKKITIIIATHRSSTLSKCNKIYKFESNGIVKLSEKLKV
tara:strand:+ start:20329 stop:22074 length:1746 start_codon:yes stop_codon:yes gene_type:complete